MTGKLARPAANDRSSDLPFVDEHAIHIDAPSGSVWDSLLSLLRGGARGGSMLARILRCEPASRSPRFAGDVGETVTGFRVAECDPGRRLALRGRHRFATYALTFEVDGNLLRASTHAEFSGLRGRFYRGLVIGSGAHRIVTRKLLERVARRARTLTAASSSR